MFTSALISLVYSLLLNKGNPTEVTDLFQVINKDSHFIVTDKYFSEFSEDKMTI